MKQRTFILTERQFNRLLERQMINEGVLEKIGKFIFKGCKTKDECLDRIVRLVTYGVISISMGINIISNGGSLFSEKDKNDIKMELANRASEDDWEEVCNDAIVTVYNAVPSQCNNDVAHTSSMFKLDHSDIGSHKIVAMERTFMKELGLKYGDVIKIVGTYKGLQDGIYQIQDTMNKRFAGQHKIDVLVPNDIKYGGTLPNKPAKVYILSDKGNTEKYLKLMKPSLKEKNNIC
jgi:hypothetical protein